MVSRWTDSGASKVAPAPLAKIEIPRFSSLRETKMSASNLKAHGKLIRSSSRYMLSASPMSPSHTRGQSDFASSPDHRNSGTASSSTDESLAAEVGHYRKMMDTAIQNDRFILYPSGNFMSFWDNLMLVLVLFTSLVTPFETAFYEPYTTPKSLDVLNRFVDFGFIVDVCINFCLAYSDSDGLVFNRHSMIAWNYAKGYLFVDVISIIPFDAFVGRDNKNTNLTRLVNMTRLLKFIRLIRLVRIVDRLRGRLMMSNAKFSLTIFFFVVIATVHWSACLWRIVPVLDDDNGQIWTRKYQFEDMGLFEQYLLCFEFALQIMVLSYGTTKPSTPLERLVAVAMMVFTGGLYAYMIASICSVVSNINPATKAYRQTSDLLKLYCVEINASKEMQRQVNEYYMQCSDVFPYRFFRRALGELSPQMQGAVANHAYKGIVSQIKFFHTEDEAEKGAFCCAVALVLQPCVFARSECILSEGSVATGLYIIQRGMAAENGHPMYRGGYFGVDSLCLRTKSPKCQHSVFSLSYLHCFHLKRADIRRILSKGNCNSILHNVHMFARKRSLRQMARHVSLLYRVVSFIDSEAPTVDLARKEHRHKMALYRKKCMKIVNRTRSLITKKKSRAECKIKNMYKPKSQSSSDALRSPPDASAAMATIARFVRIKKMARRARKKLRGVAYHLKEANVAGLLRLSTLVEGTSEGEGGVRTMDLTTMVQEARDLLNVYQTGIAKNTVSSRYLKRMRRTSGRGKAAETKGRRNYCARSRSPPRNDLSDCSNAEIRQDLDRLDRRMERFDGKFSDLSEQLSRLTEMFILKMGE